MYNIIYDLKSDWEIDYTKELFSQSELIPLDISKEYNLKNVVVVFTSNVLSYADIKKFVERVKPVIIVHLSDEWGTKPEYQLLAKNTTLLLRQYRHVNYPTIDNIVTMPLGYMNNMFGGLDSTTIDIKPASKRTIPWSFIGNMKSDRYNLIIKFTDWKGGVIKNNLKSNEMASIYLDTCFVPCGRGNVNLDCFRLYEASACGAIPVVVGKDQEIKDTFGEDLPPWVFASSWSEAVEKCQEIYNSKDIDKAQNEVVIWWRNSIANIKQKIKSLQK